MCSVNWNQIANQTNHVLLVVVWFSLQASHSVKYNSKQIKEKKKKGKLLWYKRYKKLQDVPWEENNQL